MKETPLNPTALVAAVLALAFLLLSTGCTTSQPALAPAPTTIPPATIPATIPTTAVVTAVTPDEAAMDKAFADAAEACYNRTPVIANLSDQLAFATCMEKTPLPLGNCARNWRYYVLKDTNTESTTAGFARETEDNRLAHQAYLRGEGWDEARLMYVRCGNETRIPTTILT